jgi:hypothetical protein
MESIEDPGIDIRTLEELPSFRDTLAIRVACRFGLHARPAEKAEPLGLSQNDDAEIVSGWLELALSRERARD